MRFLKKLFKHLLTTDSVTILYYTLSGILIIIFFSRVEKPVIHLLFRIITIALLIFFAFMQNKNKSRFLLFIRLFLPVIFLGYAYGDTAALNKIFFPVSFDSWFVKADYWLFGFHPSLAFSKAFPQHWISELMNAGYFSYYFMLIGITLSYYFFRHEDAEKVIFTIITSFYLYYIIFIIIPVIGPQFYFKPPLNEAPHSGLFSTLVRWVQQHWEHPTGAFPSSHVGLSIIYLLISFKSFKKIFYIFLPFAFIILFATVYIKAHYAIDVIGGIVSAPVFYYLANKCYKLFYLK